MPRRLLRPHAESYYHCIARVVDRNRSLGASEKQHFHGWMRRLEQFSGVQVVTYCLMDNHFHLLVRVPCRQDMEQREPLTEARLRQLLPLIYSGRELLGAVQELDRAAAALAAADPSWMEQVLARYSARRYSLSVFMKELKQRYTRWHNRRHKRVGTLWENRFRSVLVEGDETALLTIAAYIDLNPVRAGIVGDPKDYRWSGYGEAVAVAVAVAVAGAGAGAGAAKGQREVKNAAREGLCAILERTTFGRNRTITWRVTAPRYRMLLYGHGESRQADARTGSPGRLGMTREQVEEELTRGGELSVSEILLCKVRYLTDGAAIGGGEFLERVFEENRERFGKNRSRAGKTMRGSDWGGLRVLRGLRKDVFG